MNPFPEEFNRVVSSRIAKWNFAPTERAKLNLIDEGLDKDNIYVTGNTIIDALLATASIDVANKCPAMDANHKLIVVTVHRRENFGKPLRRICHAILKLADQYDGVRFVIPVHPNPNVSKEVHKIIGKHPKISLCKPMDYAGFVSLLKRAYLILSDSGGLQEEGPALAKPVLVLREKTERPEALEAGVVRLVGTETDQIVRETMLLLEDPEVYRDLAKGVSPYGDGHAAERIVKVLKRDCERC
jgi:UDP-N-acetylglucosamine 2-epimerase (non-hydrolysing)